MGVPAVNVLLITKHAFLLFFFCGGCGFDPFAQIHTFQVDFDVNFTAVLQQMIIKLTAECSKHFIFIIVQ